MANSRFEQFIAEVQRDPALDGINYGVFALSTHEHADWPWLNWVPKRGRVERVKDSGGGRLFGSATAATGQALRQVLNFTDQVEFEVQCWGEDFQGAEELRNRVVSALYHRCFADVKFGDYEWDTERQGEHLQRGAMVTMRATVNMAVMTSHDVTQNNDRVTRITAQDHTANFTSDLTGVNESVC